VTTVDSGYAMLLASMCAFALGMGLVVAPATASIMGAVPPERAGVGSAMNDTTRQVGGALGVALMGSIASSRYQHGVEDRLGGADLPAGAVDRIGDSVSGAFAFGRDAPASRDVVLDAARHAFIGGVRTASAVALVLLVAAALVANRFLPRQ